VGQVEGENRFSQKSFYMKKSDDKIFSLQQLIISLKDGKVASYYWDNSCIGCTDTCTEETTSNVDYLGVASENKKSNCHTQYCTTVVEGEYNCDLKVMVMWSGSDKNGNKMTSSTMRISNFEYQNPEMLYKAYKLAQVEDAEASAVVKNAAAQALISAVA
jgi:hypothetical protein